VARRAYASFAAHITERGLAWRLVAAAAAAGAHPARYPQAARKNAALKMVAVVHLALNNHASSSSTGRGRRTYVIVVVDDDGSLLRRRCLLLLRRLNINDLRLCLRSIHTRRSVYTRLSLTLHFDV
jgi:hypothetical protein